MSLLWSLWMISTALAVPFPVNTIQTGMVTDGNNDHLDAYAVRSDSYALVARGEGNSKVEGGSTSGSTSSKKAVFYYFDCESDEFLAAWYLESDPGQSSTVRPHCSGKYRLTKFELSYGGLKSFQRVTIYYGRVLVAVHHALIPISDSTPPSSQTYAALMNSKATKSADLKYVLHVTAEYEVGAWEAMQRAEGQGMEEIQETGDWTDDSA
ncbi:hypothetical protein GGU10DRAFT_335596 [Lentinula aff. detonsa]|uniref:Uncharacterized protein n=1 Tax=Lentinula aff. detonsa TaxID=2804958 RepID=A0AA38NK20_9AGAR|nr:hypothetical protein GGU10DRAFT_335596 [Lentinula aff. detonsa]